MPISLQSSPVDGGFRHEPAGIQLKIMFGQLLGPEIRALIKEKTFSALKEIFCEWPPADLADLIAELPPEDEVILFRVLPHNLAGSTFEYLRNRKSASNEVRAEKNCRPEGCAAQGRRRRPPRYSAKWLNSMAARPG